MKNVFILAAVIVVAAKVILSLSSSFKSQVVEVDDDEPVKKTIIKRSIASDKSGRINRNAFNTQKPTDPSRPDYQVTERSGGGNESEPVDEADQSGGVTSSPGSMSSIPSISDTGPSRSVSSSPSSSSKASTVKGTGATTSSGIPGVSGTGSLGGFYSGVPIPNRLGTTTTPKPATTTTTTPTDNTSTNPITLTCDASLGNGTYQNPSSVSLTCSTAATVKYCIQENTCCDPRTGGTTYAGSFTVGTAAKTYCLSFYGTAGSSSSSVVQKNYIFNPAAPHLTATHTKRYYQTTQLQGLAVMTSSDFGNGEFNVGQINTQDRDPGVSGLNLTCSQLISTYQTLAPVVVETFAPVSMSGFLPTEQIEIFLRLPRLVYGNNFLTSFAVHSNYVERAACSTTRVVLQDFPFFVTEIAHGDVGTATVREFSGGFSSLGFFEADETNLNRGPAGESTEDQSGQELRTGLFSVFF